jgi:hypothetical protein
LPPRGAAWFSVGRLRFAIGKFSFFSNETLIFKTHKQKHTKKTKREIMHWLVDAFVIWWAWARETQTTLIESHGAQVSVFVSETTRAWSPVLALGAFVLFPICRPGLLLFVVYTVLISAPDGIMMLLESIATEIVENGPRVIDATRDVIQTRPLATAVIFSGGLATGWFWRRDTDK